MSVYENRVIQLNVWVTQDLMIERAHVSNRSQIVSVDFRRGSSFCDSGTGTFDLGKVWFIHQPFEDTDVNTDEIRHAVYEAITLGSRPKTESVPVEEHVELLRRMIGWLELCYDEPAFNPPTMDQLTEELSQLRSWLNVLIQLRGDR